MQRNKVGPILYFSQHQMSKRARQIARIEDKKEDKLEPQCADPKQEKRAGGGGG